MVFPRHLAPHRLSDVVSEVDGPVGVQGLKKDTPAVIRHLHVVEVRPTTGLHADGRAEVDVVDLEALGAHVHPPVDIVWLPTLQGALQAAVVAGALDANGSPKPGWQRYAPH